MDFRRHIVRSNFFIKLKSWEYWPFGIVQFPVFFYYAWLCLRTRSLTFFAASNPGIPMGGMFGESKHDILRKIPSRFTPATILVRMPASVSDVIQRMNDNGMAFPVIFKPDLGERGFKVTRIDSQQDAARFLRDMAFDFLIQEYVAAPLEFGVFYKRHPRRKNGEVISVVMKEMLSVTGDGERTLQELILAKDRAKIHWQTLRQKFNPLLNQVVKRGDTIELVSIGNHCLGTKFIDRNDLINEALHKCFDEISVNVEGFFYGRYDLRCNSLADLYTGGVKIMELNGCGAEPAHIYDPNFPFTKAVVVLLKHWKNIFEIARENHRLGTPYIRFTEALRYYRVFKKRVN